MAKSVKKAATSPSKNKVTLDDYSRIRNKVLGPTTRQLFPKKSDLVDRKGNLRGDMDIDTLNKLLAVMEAFLDRPKQEPTRVKGKFAKPSEPDAALVAALKKFAEDPANTLRQRVEAQTAIAALRATNPAKRKSIQSAAKRAGALHSKVWYEIEYFLEDDSLDFSKMDANAFNTFVQGVVDGDFDLTDEMLDEMTPAQRKQLEDALGQGNAGDAVSSQARKIIDETLS